MKHLSSYFAFIITALLLLPNNSYADNEPNNDVASANTISLNNITNGSLSSSDIIDYYKITTTVDGRLFLDDNTSTGLGYNISLYDADGSTLIKSVTRYDSNSGTRIAVNLSPGNYYVKLNRTGYGDGTYTLNPTFSAISHTGDNESNDDFTSANTLNLNIENSGNLGSRRDGIWDVDDYWKITIPEDGRLLIKDSTVSTLGYYISIYDNDGTTLIKSVTRYESNSGTRLGVNLSPGIYFLKLHRTGYDYSNYGTYTIFPDFTPVTYPGDSESNDTYTNADVLKLNKQNSGNLGSRRDGIWDVDDYWKITIIEDGRLIIKDSTESHLGYNISIYDNDGTTLIKSETRYDSNGGNRIGINLSPGIYFLKLQRTGYDYSDYGTYTIFPDFTPVTYPGDVESNDTYTNADILELNKQNSGNLGSRRDGIWDIDDYWKITIPEDGRLIIKDTTESHLGYNIFLYDDNGTTLIKTVTRYESNGGTRIGVNLSPGIYFLKLHRTGYDYSNYGTYTIFPDFTPVTYPGDVESNDTYTNADILELNKQNSGNLGSRRDGIWDVNDYWKITIPEDGRLIIKDTTESHLGYNIFLYDDDGTTLIKSVTRYESNGGTRIGVNLSPGIYLLKLQRTGYDYSAYGTYTIFPDFTPVTYPGDVEPNDSLAIAVNLALNTQNTGNLGSWRDGDWDKFDYWKISLPEDGRLIIKDTTEANLGYHISIYNNNGTTLIKAATRYESNGGTRIDVNLSVGHYLLVLERTGYNYSNYGSYTIFPEYIKSPKAEFEIFQDIKTVSFANKTVDGESYSWDFDDGTTSELVNPSHTYSEPGEYLVSLTASNLAGENTVTRKVIIYGIKDVSPASIGNNGVVTISVTGGGFTENSTVVISNGNGIEIESNKTIFFELGSIVATFNLSNINLGSWNIYVRTPGLTDVTLENAINVVESNEAEPWVNVVGRSRALFNKWQTYTLEYGNTGNVDADYVPFFITISDPENNQLEFIDLNVVYPDYIVNNGLEEEFDKFNYFFDLDTVFGEVQKTRIYPLVLPKIPAGFTGSIKFKIKTSSTVILNAWNNAPLMVNGSLAKNCDKNEDALGKCIHKAMAVAVTSGAVTLADNVLPGYACVVSIASETVTTASNLFTPKPQDPNIFTTTAVSFLGSLSSVFLNCIGSAVKTIAWPYNLAMGVVGIVQMGSQAYYDVEVCKEKFGRESFRNKKIRGVTSFDPNEIVGPSGFGDNNYISMLNAATYTIFFENKSSASAPAQEIWITDTLDLDKFDLNNFSFNRINIANTSIKLASGQTEFTKDIDFRPEQNIIGRVTGTIDKDKGIIKIYFTSLDPETMSDNEDPDFGILQPNTNSPQGEGNISFTVGVKNQTDGSSFQNKATIVFDYNDAITTNSWINFIDEKAPSSKIESFSYDEETRNITFNINGNDNESGIMDYTVYYSKNEEEYIPLVRTYTNTVVFELENNTVYKFYSVASDKVGNIETSPNVADINFEVLGNTDYDNFSMYNIYPNPVQGIMYIDSQMNGDSYIEIIDTRGRTVATKLMKTISGNIDLSSLNKGAYYVRITNDEFSTVKKIVIE